MEAALQAAERFSVCCLVRCTGKSRSTYRNRVLGSGVPLLTIEQNRTSKEAAVLPPLRILFSYNATENSAEELETTFFKGKLTMGGVWGFVVIHRVFGTAFQCL